MSEGSPDTTVLHNPLKNRGLAFSHEERSQLGIEGLLPPAVRDQTQQALRAYKRVQAAPSPLDKYRELMNLQDRNEYLFYRVLLDHLPELMPIVYTPTVGEAAQKYSQVFQRGRGLWITPEHTGRVKDVIAGATQGRTIRLLVVTDNEAILGLGDQGVGGMTISIGKLSLYTACAGIAPETTLPISLDVGTDNSELRNDPDYVGLNQPRLRGAAYDAFVGEFVEAVNELFPGALVQWEDFRKDNALNTLDRYRSDVLSFNDDIQGTGATALAGIYSALRIKGVSLASQRFLIHGAGAAGLGIARQIKAALVEEGVAPEDLDQHIGLLDSRGLLVKDRQIADAYKQELAWTPEAAQAIGLGEERGLTEVVDAFKPTVLIGTSGQPGSFTEAIIRSIYAHCADPVIMPLSNPTSATEAFPGDILEWTDGNALIATGSPFEPVTYNEREYRFGQGNNVFIFPALGFASLIGEAREVTDAMITAASKTLAETLTEEELAAGLLYPDVGRLRDVTAQVAAGVLDAALSDGSATIEAPADVHAFVREHMWSPSY